MSDLKYVTKEGIVWESDILDADQEAEPVRLDTDARHSFEKGAVVRITHGNPDGRALFRRGSTLFPSKHLRTGDVVVVTRMRANGDLHCICETRGARNFGSVHAAFVERVGKEELGNLEYNDPRDPPSGNPGPRLDETSPTSNTREKEDKTTVRCKTTWLSYLTPGREYEVRREFPNAYLIKDDHDDLYMVPERHVELVEGKPDNTKSWIDTPPDWIQNDPDLSSKEKRAKSDDEDDETQTIKTQLTDGLPADWKHVSGPVWRSNLRPPTDDQTGIWAWAESREESRWEAWLSTSENYAESVIKESVVTSDDPDKAPLTVALNLSDTFDILEPCLNEMGSPDES